MEITLLKSLRINRRSISGRVQMLNNSGGNRLRLVGAEKLNGEALFHYRTQDHRFAFLSGEAGALYNR